MYRIIYGLSLILIFLSLQTCAKEYQIEEQYFIFYSGTQVNFRTFDHLSIDTIFVRNNNRVSYVLLDSISEYHHHKPGKKAMGSLIGASAGIVLGAIIGSIVAPSIDKTNLGTSFATTLEKSSYPFFGAAIGLPIGGLLGFAIGSAAGIDINKDFRTLNKQYKLLYFQNLMAS